MAVVLKYDSSIGAGDSISDGHIDRTYLVGASSDADAYSQLLAHADCPDSITTPFGEVFRKSLRVDHIGGGNYECDCHWQGAAIPATATESEKAFIGLSFSTTGKTEHITQSLNTKRYPATGPDAAPDFKNQIGVTEDGVDGIDIVVPAFSWSEQHAKVNSEVTASYLNVLKNLTGSVNNATFRGHAAGEVLFLGCTGSRENAYRFQMVFEFTSIPNATLTVGDITGVEKHGHEYMWTRWERIEDTGGEYMLQNPLGVYVERVYPLADFSTLGIGVASI